MIYHNKQLLYLYFIKNDSKLVYDNKKFKVIYKVKKEIPWQNF